MESLQERQDNEIQALKAIYGPSELRDLRETDAWRVRRAPEIVLTLTPQQGMSGPGEVYSHIDLHVVCADNYPEQVPTLVLEKSKGLSLQQVAQLQQELENMAQELKGEVMIFELAQHVQKYLLAFNKPGFQSFYEEMQARQAQQEQQKELLRQQEQDRERQAVQEHMQRKQQALKEEQRRRRERQSSISDDISLHHTSNQIVPQEIQRSSSLSHVTSRHRTQSSSGSGEKLLCDHGGAKVLKFPSERQIRRGNCLGHGARGSVVFGAQDVETGEMLAVTQWKIKSCLPRRKGSLDLSLNPELATLQKQLSSVEQELGLLQRLSHPGLVRYQAMTNEHQQGNLVISILQDFVQGVSLAMFLEEKIGLGLELLRHIARGVLDSLAFLHRNNVVHRDLRHSSVFLHQTGIVMLSDYSLDRRLGEIVLGTERVDCGLPPGLGRGGKKCDVHRLGSLLISLLQGESISEAAPSPPPGLSPEITDFLEKCLVRDEHVRWSAEQLLQHSFLTPNLDPGSGISPQRTDIRRDRRESEVSPEDSRLLLPLSGGRGGPSRVITEFEVLQWLGKGAFGDVLKVRNKLDARVYALKRIKLNPRNKALNRKITREVKLLSRLNHENVVRYYNSWIESAVIPAGEGSSESSSQITTPTPRESKPVSQHADAGLQDASVVEWSVSEARPQIESDSSSDEDEEPWHAFFPGSSSSSSSIVFEGGDGGEDAIDASSPPPQTSTPELPELQFMYIQMEFCEKSTLRNVIDSGGLSDDESRLWRLFREMVEGLAHIHQQGMIHRDLKPVNVFLDLHDHVKIGDFGLATWRALHDDVKVVPSLTPLVIDQQNNSSHDLGDGILTGQVGTALYTAPELSNAAIGKAVFYNQKVDIYSLGIIFFEMCHPPWDTGMERVKTIAALRSPQITLPKDYTEKDHPQQVLLLRLLLNHEPAQRPTAQELLRATPLQHEEAQLHEVLRHSLANPQSKAYKHLVSACIDQVVSPAEDMTYDLGLGKSGAPTWALRAVRSAVERVFERHGAVRLATPLLMPRSRTIPTSSVALMSHSGSVVTLPHDLRLPFARYVAWNGVTSLKRFSVERVYRERRVYGLHPRELYECAFDIVTPTPCSALGEAELLCVVWEALHEVSSHAHCVIRLNHSTLVRAVLLHCGVEEERHIEITNILSEARDGLLSRPQVQTRFRSLCLPQHTHDVLLSLLNTEAPLAQAAAVRALAKGRGTVASLAKEGLRHIEGVAQAAENLGVKCTILVAPGLVLDPGRYSGLLCQIACEGGRGSRAKHARRDVIAIGGTYSHLIEQFRCEMERSCGNTGSRTGGACGISLSLERLATSLQDSDADSTAAAADALVVALSPRALQRDAPAVARELWAAGVKTLLSDVVQGVEEAQAQSRELRAQHLVLVKDGEAVRVRSWEKDRFQERRLSATELTEWLVARRGPSSSSSTTESTEVVTNVVSTAAGNPSVNFHFLTSEKLAYNTRRRYESQMTGHLASLLRNLTSRACVEVVALSADAGVVRTLSSTLELAGDEDTFTSTIAVAMDKLARHRKYLGQICDKLHELRFEKSSTLILLYSLPDNVCKTLF